MCDPDEGYTTLVGPRNDLEQIGQMWDDSATARYLELHPPVFTNLSEVGFEFGDENFPAVAYVRHQPGSGPMVASLLQSELMVRGNRVVCEAGHRSRPAMSQPIVGGSVELDPDAMRMAVAHTPWPGQVGGRKVAILDSGLGEFGDGIDFTAGWVAKGPTPDRTGHGTAVAEIIRRARPEAELHVLKVMDGPAGESFKLFNALIYALWSLEDFDVINASLSVSPIGPCPSSLGRTIDFLLAMRGELRRPMPRIVAAIGNQSSMSTASYPAVLPTATAAMALGWNGEPSSYNASLPPGARPHIAYAPGGEAGQPLGLMTSTAGKTTEIWGTSFAAALVTAALLP